MKRLLVVLISLVAVALSAAPSDAARVRVVTYPGFGQEVRLDSPDGLDATSAAFREFVQRELVATWQANDPAPACRRAAVVHVKRWRSDGFARGDVGMDGSVTNGACNVGGGAAQIFVRRHGAWRAPRALAYQDLVRCSTFRRFHLPRNIATHRCLDSSNHAVVYKP